MRGRWLMVMLVCTALPLIGCGADKASSSGSTTVANDAAATTAAEEVGDPNDPNDPSESTAPTAPDTVPDDEFSAVIDDINARLDAAGDDPCKILEAFGTSAPSPANAAQTEQAVDVIADLLVRLADSAPPAAAASADAIRATAAALPVEAAEVSFDPEQVNLLPAFKSPEFGQAMAELGTVANCTLGGPSGG